jgi:ribosome-associated toxin RatA of RatAB toxin-antitoxin module
MRGVYRAVCENSALPREESGGVAHLKVVDRSAIVTATPAQMFALVDDVPRYPEFLPGCVAARLESAAANERVAALEIVRAGVRMEFTTRNTLTPPAEILMELVRGPFTRLIGRWRFEPIGEQGSRVAFHVEFEFKNRLLGLALNPLFESVCDKIVDSFVVRAREVYGAAPRGGG